MRRPDVLTYDVEDSARRRVPWRSLLLLAAVVAVGALLIVWTATSGTTSASKPPAPSAVSKVAESTTPTITGSPTTTAPAGSDETQPSTAPTESRQAVEEFVRAWLDRDPQSRKQALQDSAVPALAEQLELTSLDNVPAARPVGPPSVEDVSPYSVTFSQQLSSDLTIRVLVVADPQARLGWLATSVEQV
ncbi:cell division protein FtsN [Friedmanniella endophytica]|uniref:Cell division protein FtsN n=1 Tax=Microlunatus kandeliicorticis TaxID=1759536 RepID=A0A7W3IR34_9ACTN|nr:hypothetical protein [Microlunatus kandeliicorticis]MBA8793673.1 cell division protein FtsN [Microlunatus kandeliicorticis]